MGRISDSLSDVDYEQHEDTQELVLAGDALPFFIGRITFDLVKQHEDDVDFTDLLQRLEDSDEDAPIEERIDLLGRLIWAGLLVFEPGLDYTLIKRRISMGDVKRLSDFVKSYFGRLKDDDADAPAGKA